MNVLHLSAECYPVAKAGGLGDVVGALPKYQKMEGVNAMVVMPFYDKKFVREQELTSYFYGTSALDQKEFHYEILTTKDEVLGFPLYLVKIIGLLDRQEIYGYPDEIDQFVSYQLAVLDWLVNSDLQIDILHCHDHHSGLVPFLTQHSSKFNKLKDIPTVCTIHNGQYQGWMGWDKYGYLPDTDPSKTGLLDWGGCINSLAAAVKCCWAYTTVSPSYLEELKHEANGLEFLFEMEQQKGFGILNGIDPDVWNPLTDSFIAKNYTIKNVKVGKSFNKLALCQKFDLDPNKPLFTFIGRLVLEKGADKLADVIKESVDRFGDAINILVLGSGEKYIEQELRILGQELDNVAIFIGYNEELSHQIYAGADFILMPSRVEPCGLNQLYALKYGTVPIVRSTGGLKDSIIDIDENDGYGLRFDHCVTDDIVYTIDRALALSEDIKTLNNKREFMMNLDFSWNKSAQQYIKLYTSLISRS
jgi:starch synthase